MKVLHRPFPTCRGLIAGIRPHVTSSFQFISCPPGGQAGQAITWPSADDFIPPTDPDKIDDSFTHIAPMMYTSPYSYSQLPRPWGTIDIDFNVAYCINAPGSTSSTAIGLDGTHFATAAAHIQDILGGPIQWIVLNHIYVRFRISSWALTLLRYISHFQHNPSITIKIRQQVPLQQK